MKKIVSLLLVALLVIGMFPIAPIHAHAAGTYTKATSIAVGDVVVFVCESKKMELTSLTTSAKYGTGTAYTDAPAGTMLFNVVEGSSDGTVAFENNGYYLYWSSDNTLYIKNTMSANTSWKVSFDSNGNADVANAANNNRMIRWNASAPRFACYTSAQTDIQIYKKTCEHTVVVDAAVEATCTATGLTEGSHCSVCNTVIVVQEEVPMIDHNYVDGACSACGEADPSACAHANTKTVTVDATCTVAGSETVVCADCGEVQSTTEIPASGHTEVANEDVAPTCTAVGKTGGSHCSVCNEVIVAAQDVAMVDHTYVDGTCACGAIDVVTPAVPESGNYVLVTDINEILSGGKFVIAVNYNSVNYAMSVATSGKPSAVEVAVSGDKVAYTEGTTPVWTIGKYGANIVLFNGEEYLGYGTSGTDFVTKTEPYAWVVETGENNTFTITSSAVNTRGIIYRNTGVFAPYATSNRTNTGYYGYLNFYKLTEGEVEVITSTVSIKENNTDISSQEVAVGSTFTLPEATAEVPEGYTFAGWVEGSVTDTAIAPETIYAAGDAYSVNDAVTFYALYSRSETVEDGIVYQLVSSTDTLAAGDKIVIAAADADVAMSTTQNTNNRGQATIAKNESQIAFDNDVQILTLETGTVEGTLAMNTGSGYLYAASGSSNYLKTKAELDGNGSWLITVAEDGTASVVAQGSNAVNVMRYNQNNELFSCYASGKQSAIVLYKETTGPATVTVYTTCSHENGVVTDAAVEATCTEDGKTEGSHCELCGTVFVAQEVIEATGHSYGNVVVTTPATLQTAGEGVKTCATCGHEETITISAQQGDVERWSLTLGGDLTVNFEIYINNYIKESAKVNITVGGKTYSYAAADAPYGEGYNCYLFSASVAASQMNDTITVQIVNGTDVSLTKEYTVLAYAQAILADETQSQYHDLIKEMLNYGAAAQTYFAYNKDNLVNSVITDTTDVGDKALPESVAGMSATGIIDGVSFYAASLVHRNKAALRFYFSASSIEGLTFAVNGTECNATPKDDYYVVEVADILPQDLDAQYTVTVTNDTDTITVVYSPIHYMVRMNAKGIDPLKALLKAMYNYHLAAKEATSAAE